jgi:hypothetical protein
MMMRMITFPFVVVVASTTSTLEKLENHKSVSIYNSINVCVYSFVSLNFPSIASGDPSS